MEIYRDDKLTTKDADGFFHKDSSRSKSRNAEVETLVLADDFFSLSSAGFPGFSFSSVEKSKDDANTSTSFLSHRDDFWSIPPRNEQPWRLQSHNKFSSQNDEVGLAPLEHTDQNVSITGTSRNDQLCSVPELHDEPDSFSLNINDQAWQDQSRPTSTSINNQLWSIPNLNAERRPIATQNDQIWPIPTPNDQGRSLSSQPNQFSSMPTRNKENFTPRSFNSRFRPLFKSPRQIAIAQPFVHRPEKPFPASNSTERNYSQSSNQSFRLPFNCSQNSTSQYFDQNFDNLKSVTAIPERFRRIFSQFPRFNFIQSKVFDEVLYTDKSIVVSAPTGSGKTVILELAIVRLLMKYSSAVAGNIFKIVYMAPIKALCNERYADWREKFTFLGLNCAELTGDTEGNEYFLLQDAHIIMTTPEKWDSLTRSWSKNDRLVLSVKLFFIDEVHLLNDDTRGPTLEAVVSRMKMSRSSTGTPLRFLATSATIPNADDIAEWLGQDEMPAVSFKVGDDMRPVKLKKVVIAYPCPENWTQFRFDLSLSYKLSAVINTYAERRPTLVFCATRSAVVETAKTLSREMGLQIDVQQKQELFPTANAIKDAKLRELVLCGIAFHHAGLAWTDRQLIEELFSNNKLPVLLATSTLAMGVNLPAHLVVVKSTFKYIAGTCVEYSESEILQMIGRAGRPQFDTSGTAVIMTKYSLKDKYQSLIGGTQMIESHLHKHLIEHLNAEIVLKTITNVGVLLTWIKSTYLYVRVTKNPKLYSIPDGLVKSKLDDKLLEICVSAVNTLAQYEIILMSDDGFDLSPTNAGRLMARYYLAFDTMKLFMQIGSEASISDLVTLLASCKEFSDISLRTSEKKTLNLLNNNKHKITIRFPIEGKIKTREMKINCLIQASFGSIPIQEPGLNQEVVRIIRIGRRISRCLSEFLISSRVDFKTCLNALLLAKCFRAQLWENSSHVAKQLDKIGTVMANALVNAGLTSFQKIDDTNPRELEVILNRNPPFGNMLLRSVNKLPKFQITLEQSTTHLSNSAEITIKITLKNWENLTRMEKTEKSSEFSSFLLIGDVDDKIVLKQKISKWSLMQIGHWTKRIDVHKAKRGNELYIRLINDDIVGVDVQTTFTPVYTGDRTKKKTDVDFPDDDYLFHAIQEVPPTPAPIFATPRSTNVRQCNHTCANKETCRHKCCKIGVSVKTRKRLSTEDSAKQSRISLAETYQEKAACFPNCGFDKKLEPNPRKCLSLSGLKRCQNKNDADSTPTILSNSLIPSQYEQEEEYDWSEWDSCDEFDELDSVQKTKEEIPKLPGNDLIDLTSSQSEEEWPVLIYREDLSEIKDSQELAIAEDFQDDSTCQPIFNLGFDFEEKLDEFASEDQTQIREEIESLSEMFVKDLESSEKEKEECISMCYDLMKLA